MHSKVASSLRSKFVTLYAQLPYLPQAFTLVWAAARRWTIAWAIMLVLSGLLPVATVYLTRTLVDTLVAALDSGGSLRPTLILVALMALIMLLQELLRSATSWVRTAQSELVQDHISNLIHRQAIRLDLGFYEAPHSPAPPHSHSPTLPLSPSALLAFGVPTFGVPSPSLNCYSNPGVNISTSFDMSRTPCRDDPTDGRQQGLNQCRLCGQPGASP